MDCRERNKWYDSFDEKTMTVTIEGIGEDGSDVDVPVKYEVCNVCHGLGKHVNPNIDSHGISSEEFADDPDFAEAYFRGDYDVLCNQCHGSRVSPVVDEDKAGPEIVKRLYEYLDDKAAYAAECAAERRMGC